MSWDGPKTLTIAGETRTVADWARISGICYNTLYYRLRNGTEPSAAVFGALYSTEMRREYGSSARPGYIKRREKKRAAPVRFDVGQLPRWGSVLSINFRRAA